MLKTLMRVRLASLFHSLTSGGRNARNGKPAGKGRLVLVLFALAYAFIAVGGLFFLMFMQLSEAYHDAGLGWLYFAVFTILDLGIMVVGTVFSAKTQLYEAKDNELLLSMPVRPGTILVSRMAMLLGLNYVMELVAAIPAGFNWFSRYPDPSGLVSFLLFCIALPLFAMAVSALLAWIISVATARARKKNLITVILSLLFLVAYMYGVNRMNAGIEYLAANGKTVAGALGGVAPLIWIGQACSGGNLSDLLLGLSVCVAPFALAVYLLSVTFLKTALPRGSSRRVRTKAGTDRASSVSTALLRIELSRFGSSTSWLLNGAFGAVFLVIGGILLLVKQNLFDSALTIIPGLSAYLPLLLHLAVGFLCGFVSISCCAVSMEGRSLWVLRSLPVKAKDVLFAKSRLHTVVFLPCLVIAEIGILVALRLDALTGILFALGAASFVLYTADLGVMLNLRHPLLDWVNESQPVKSSTSLLLCMLLGTSIPIAVSGIALIPLLLGQPSFLSGAVWCLLMAALALIERRRLLRRGPSLWNNL